MPPSVGRPAGVSADCVLLRDYSAGRFWSTTREVDGRQALPMFWINIWSQSSFGVAKWLMLIVLINNSKSWSGTSSARSHRERREQRVNMSCRAERRGTGGWHADSQRARWPEKCWPQLNFPHSADVSGQRNAYGSLFPRWGDFVSFIWQEQRGWEAENSFMKASPAPR